MKYRARATALTLALTLLSLVIWSCSGSQRDFGSPADKGGAANAGAAGNAAAGEAGATASEGGAADAGAAGSAGAGADAGSAGDSSGPPDPREPFATWDAARIQAECQKDVACGRVASSDACTRIPGQDAAYGEFFGGADFYGAQVDDYRLADVSLQKACLDGISAAACDQGAPPACSQVLVPLAPRRLGEACGATNPYLPLLPCSVGYKCLRSGLCPVCVAASAPQGLGGPCDYQEDCNPTLTCRVAAGATVSTCEKRSEPGAACILNTDCRVGRCSQNLCTSSAIEGQACSPTVACIQGLICDAKDNLCHADPAPGPGDACPRHIKSGAEACRSWCVFPTPDAATGVCGLPVMQGPTPCSRYSEDTGLFCPQSTYADTQGAVTQPDQVADYCECLPRRPNGAACTDAAQCVEGRCLPGSKGSVCAARLAEGEPCTGPGQCQGNCNTTSKTCESPKACGVP